MVAVVDMVDAAVTFPLRHAVLGRGQTPTDLAVPDDTDPDSGHFAIRLEGRVVATGTVRRRASSRGGVEPEWQVRGMAVEEGLRGRGYGTQVLLAILDHVAARGGGQVWCHARIAAESLYQRHGFAAHGGPFEDDIAWRQVLMTRHVAPADRSRVHVVVSGAPGTGKSTVAAALAERLDAALLSLDVIKEALADALGLGDEAWSDRVGDAAAEVIFRVAPTLPRVVVEGWWRGERRDRAVREFAGWAEVFCRCDPPMAERRMRSRTSAARHPIHRDVINPAILERAAPLAATVTPLALGATLVEVDTTDGFDVDPIAEAILGAP